MKIENRSLILATFTVFAFVLVNNRIASATILKTRVDSSDEWRRMHQTEKSHPKRRAPAEVAPIVDNTIQYGVPHYSAMCPGMRHNGGYVEAKDVKTGQRVWLKEVYAPAADHFREHDVQDVFITSMTLKDGVLNVTDEKGKKYEVPTD